MKALQIQSPGVIGLIDVPKPIPASGEVLLRVRRAGYCGTDLSTFRGVNPLVSYPRIPGHELGGTIVEVGADVPGEWAVGTDALVIPYTTCGKCSACRQGRVNCCRYNQTLGVQREGGICEFIAVPWQKLLKHPALSLAELALVEPLTVGFHATARGRVTDRDAVLVLGCGAIGLGAISGAASRGARVLAVDLDDRKLELARHAGAAQVINSGKQNLADVLLDWTSGEGPEVIIEAIGLPATFRMAVDAACFAGRVVYIGYAKAPVEYETKAFVQKELDIMGSRNATQEDFEAVIAMLAAKRFPVAEAITRTVPLAEAPGAMQAWNDAPLEVTKIQIDLD